MEGGIKVIRRWSNQKMQKRNNQKMIIETKMFSISSCLPTEKKNIVNGRKVRFVEVRKTFIDERLNITAFRKIKKPFSQAA
mmetsp:Transcript_775/g.929  ORF Transcript_775/g.929 Transcript_775/m.929 type:complete len:81 (+) Transcript_775:1274-1516(+)